MDILRIPNDASAPLVVHCSAGLGRTGTFLLALSLLKQSEVENKIESVELLTQMRVARPGLIQSEEQYMFVLEALAEALNSSAGAHPTLMSAKDIPKRVEELSNESGSSLTGFRDTF